MKRSELILSAAGMTALPLLSACGVRQMLADANNGGSPIISPDHLGNLWSWTDPDGSAWKIQFVPPPLHIPHLLVYYSPFGPYGPWWQVGEIEVLPTGYMILGVGCLSSPPSCTPPPGLVPWQIRWDNGGTKWTPGEVINLFKDYWYHVAEDPSGPPGGTLTRNGVALASWTGNQHTLRATHTSFSRRYPFQVQYSYDVGQGGGGSGPELSADCGWKLAGFLGATALAMCAVATVETGVGAVAAAGAILVMAEAGYDFKECK